MKTQLVEFYMLIIIKKVKALFLLMLVLFAAGCSNSESPIEKDEKDFCFYVNEENIDQTIPFINEFLSGLSNDEQPLQALEAWLKSQPCIFDATFFASFFCSENNPEMSEILISFDENKIMKKIILDVLVTKPLNAIGYHDYKVGKNPHDQMHCIQLKEITEENLEFIVYTTIAGGGVSCNVEYDESVNNTIKVNILYSQGEVVATCIFLQLASVSIKKGIYQKAVISTFINRFGSSGYLPIDSREISLPNTKN